MKSDKAIIRTIKDKIISTKEQMKSITGNMKTNVSDTPTMQNAGIITVYTASTQLTTAV